MSILSRDADLLTTLAEELHFGRASDRLSCSQPQLSLRLARLETKLGVKLFERRPRVVLTDAGAIMLDATRRACAEITTAVRRARDADRARETIVVGVASTAMATELPLVLGTFQDAHPELTVRVRDMHSALLWDALVAGAVDLAVTREVRNDPDMEHRMLVDDSVVLAVPARHALSRRASAGISAFHEESLVFVGAAAVPTLHSALVSLFERAGSRPQFAQEVDDWPTVLGLVRGGFGVALLPSTAVQETFPGVSVLTLEGDRLSSPLYLCSRRKDPSSGARMLVQYVADSMRWVGDSRPVSTPARRPSS